MNHDAETKLERAVKTNYVKWPAFVSSDPSDLQKGIKTIHLQVEDKAHTENNRGFSVCVINDR